MFNVMLIDPENIKRCEKLLNVPQIGERLVTNPTWILWTNDDVPTAWTLPHVIFRDRYTIVGQADECLIAERI